MFVHRKAKQVVSVVSKKLFILACASILKYAPLTPRIKRTTENRNE